MELITDLSQLNPNSIYTYADYLNWRLKERIELIRGKILKMSPAPSRRHQDISSNIFGIFHDCLKRGQATCKIYTAPFDVRLNEVNRTDSPDDIYTVVQPDLCIICDRSKLDERGCLGAPDLIVEILSPGNSKKEAQTKFELYESSGVREYWIVFPSEEVLQQFVLNEHGKYDFRGFYTPGDIVQATIFESFQADITVVFSD